MKARASIVVTGVVHGVGYRYFAQKKALSLGLTGWVRNLTDGSVEAKVEGDKGRIEAFLADCRRGPELSFVDDVEVTWAEWTGDYSGFEVVPTRRPGASAP